MSAKYLQLTRAIAIPDYQTTPGNCDASAFKQINGAFAHCIILNFWDSKETLGRFAIENIDTAKSYDFDPNFLIELEPIMSLIRTVVK